MRSLQKLLLSFVIVFTSLALFAEARADALTDWNTKACEIVGPTSFDAPSANRMLAIMHTAIYEAVNAITKKYPRGDVRIDAPSGASVDAAIAAAGRITLLKFASGKETEIESAYHTALAAIPDGPSKTNGIAVGEAAAAAILAYRTDDGYATAETYRPYTIAGVYVPTVVPVVSHWPQRKPWLMSSANQFRPDPPPDLKSDLWTRDYNEIKAIGGKKSAARTAEQTGIARFWEATGPAIYHNLVASVSKMPGRDVTQNARLYMIVTQATDDAMIAVFDAKYYYNFWRPVTAIRNGDIDGNDKTERDASWTPFINTPMHPEYPCAHCIVSGAVGTILQAEIGSATSVFATTSPTANNTKRTWMKIEDFMQEVANGRIYDGVHFRNSTEVGTEMGRKIGKLFATKHLGTP